MRFPCKHHEKCENYNQNACEGCGELKRYPEWFIKCGEAVARLILGVKR